MKTENLLIENEAVGDDAEFSASDAPIVPTLRLVAGGLEQARRRREEDEPRYNDHRHSMLFGDPARYATGTRNSLEGERPRMGTLGNLLPSDR